MSVSRHPSWDSGSTYSPSILVDMCTPSWPWGEPERPTTSPLSMSDPEDTEISDRYDTETLKPATGSMVTERIPATEPAKVTRPEAGARTAVPAGTE